MDVARASSKLEARELVLQRELAGHPLVLPGLAVGIGIPAAAILLPIGALLIEDGNTYKDYPDDPAYSPTEGAHTRRVGASLVSAGILGMAAAIYGSMKIHSVRGRRRAAELELAAIRALRIASGGGAPATASLFGAADVSDQVSRQKRGTSLTSRGKKMITGGVTLGLTSPNGHTRRWNLGLTPGFAYFVADRLAIGATLLISRGDEDLGYGLSRQSLAMGGGLRVIYELSVGSNVGVWVWPSLGYAWIVNHDEIPGPPPSYYYDSQPTQVQTGFPVPRVQRRPRLALDGSSHGELGPRRRSRPHLLVASGQRSTRFTDRAELLLGGIVLAITAR